MIKIRFSILLLSILSSLLFVNGLDAQVSASYGNMYIHAKGSLAIFGSHHFGAADKSYNSAIIRTNRGTNPGMISFVNKALWTNANDFRHVDGYARSFKSDAFTFPIGNLGFYRPISIVGGYGMSAAYYLDNPEKLPNVSYLKASSQEFNVSDIEYWNIAGNKEAIISLTYDSNSDIESLTSGDLSKLRILGWNGSEWEVIPAEIDDEMIDISVSNGSRLSEASNLELGSITTTKAIVPSDYQILTFGVETRTGDLVDGDLEYNSALVSTENIDLTVFPNPTFNLDNLNIDYNLQNVEGAAFIEIYNSNGELIYRNELSKRKDIYKLPFSEDVNGTYYLGIVSESGSRIFKPVIVTAR